MWSSNENVYIQVRNSELQSVFSFIKLLHSKAGCKLLYWIQRFGETEGSSCIVAPTNHIRRNNSEYEIFVESWYCRTAPLAVRAQGRFTRVLQPFANLPREMSHLQRTMLILSSCACQTVQKIHCTPSDNATLDNFESTQDTCCFTCT